MALTEHFAAARSCWMARYVEALTEYHQGVDMRHFVLAILLCTLPVGATWAADVTPDSICSQFFDALIKGDSDKAVDGFFGRNPQFKDRAQQITLVKTQLTGALKVFGPATAAEMVSSEDLSPSLHRRVYITKHEYHPLTWEFYFYKAKAVWLPDQLTFVDQYQVIGSKK